MDGVARRALLETIALADAAVATSGDYVRFHDVERRYHHTVVPATGRSPQAVASVTVRAPTAMAADALATAVFALGPDEGLRWLSGAAAPAKALVIARDGRRHATGGWARAAFSCSRSSTRSSRTGSTSRCGS